MFNDGDFRSELAQFLSRGDVANLDVTLPSSSCPQYINTLLTGVLHSVGCIADIPCLRNTTELPSGILRGVECTPDASRITKRVHDRFRSMQSDSPSRRSALWLFIRVIIQMSNRCLGRSSYKQFILFFMCTLARDECNTDLSSEHLHLMESTILRRLSKFGSSTPNWLSELALKTSACLLEILDTRWKELKPRRSSFQNPSQDELIRDTSLSLLNSREYILDLLENHGHESVRPPFHPIHHRRGTIEDFLSSNGTFFDEAYDADPNIAIHDIELSIEEGIDDWLACVKDVDEACAQLELLMDRYVEKTLKLWEESDPEYTFRRLLTALELYVALDRLIVQEIPILADYPPAIPIAVLENVQLRRTTSLHRLSCVYRYLSARHSRSHPGWSVVSNEVTEDSFPVRYYDQAPDLQQLKARIEEDAIKNVAWARTQHEGLACAHDEYQQDLPAQRPARSPSQSPLPASLLHAKAIVFELNCPAYVQIWRSAAFRFWWCYNQPQYGELEKSEFRNWFEGDSGIRSRDLLAHVPELQPYFVERQGPLLHFQIDFAYFYPDPARSSQFRDSPTLCYVVQCRDRSLPHSSETISQACLAWEPWRNENYENWGQVSRHSWFFTNDGRAADQPHCDSCQHLGDYADNTSHKSNNVLSSQVDCPADLSLDEFLALAHVRSGGLLQWLNILQGLRSRTLNLRRHQVYFLIQTTFQVGPLDLNTGVWIWHQELQDSSFCNALLDELENLLTDVGAGSMDAVLMNNVSLLLTRVLASSPSEDVSQRGIVLLRGIRRKTFSWVQELLYDLTLAPLDTARADALFNMAATCRSTFDVGPAIFNKVFHSAEDVDALLSCAFFVSAFCPQNCRCMSNSQISTSHPTNSSTYQSSIMTTAMDIHRCFLNETAISLSLSSKC